MTYLDPKANLDSLQDHLDTLKQATRLLKLASKQIIFDKDSFENMHYLLDMYLSMSDNYLEELTCNLNRVHRYVCKHQKDVSINHITPKE